MKLIIGLGNPGLKYRKTRHNAGFLMLDQLIENLDGFSKFKKAKNIQAETSEGKVGSEKITLAKPQTYMNNSGIAVKALVNSYKLSVNSNLIVVHDDFDIPFGEFKIQINRGPAGHNGVKAIIECLGTKDFARIRIGVRPTDIEISNINTQKFVLQLFSKKEIKNLETDIFPEILKEIETL